MTDEAGMTDEPGVTDEAWARLEKSTVLQSPWYSLSHDRYRRPDGVVGDYYYVDIAGSTMVVPCSNDGSLILVRQYRYLFRRWSLEFPAGGLPWEADPLQNAKKELLEESGYVGDRWEKIGEFAPYNGVSNEICFVFEAGDLTLEGAEPEPTEEIEVVKMTPAEIQAVIASGELWDGMTVASFLLWQSRQSG